MASPYCLITSFTGGLWALMGPLVSDPELPRPVGLGTPSDGWGAAAVRGPGKTVKKETAGKPLKPAAPRETVGEVSTTCACTLMGGG